MTSLRVRDSPVELFLDFAMKTENTIDVDFILNKSFDLLANICGQTISTEFNKIKSLDSFFLLLEVEVLKLPAGQAKATRTSRKKMAPAAPSGTTTLFRLLPSSQPYNEVLLVQRQDFSCTIINQAMTGY